MTAEPTYEYRVACDDPAHGAPEMGSLSAVRRYLAGTEHFTCRPRAQRRLAVTPPPWEDMAVAFGMAEAASPLGSVVIGAGVEPSPLVTPPSDDAVAFIIEPEGADR